MPALGKPRRDVAHDVTEAVAPNPRRCPDSAFLSLREFLKLAARQRRGNAVLIGSTAAVFGEAGHADYAAAKAALAFGLTRTLKNEMAGWCRTRPITVADASTASAPGGR